MHIKCSDDNQLIRQMVYVFEYSSKIIIFFCLEANYACILKPGSKYTIFQKITWSSAKHHVVF